MQFTFVKKKPSVMGALKILQPKNHFLSKILKNPKGGPFYVKKIFVPDFAKILYVRSQGHKDQKFWVSSKSESKNFFDPKGGPFYFKKKILSLILLKIGVNDCETISISYFNFHPNRRQFFFLIQRGDPTMSKKFLSRILITFCV